MINVLFIGPSTQEAITDTRWVTAPLGVHYVASYLNRNGVHAEVWDINIDELSYEEKVRSNTWDIIAFSTLEATAEYDMAKIHTAKKLSPKSILLAGGTGASLNYQEYFNKTPLDLVVQLEGEFPILKLCRMMEDKGYEFSPVHMIDGVIVRRKAKELTPEEYWEIRKDLDVKAMKASCYWEKTAKMYDHPDYSEVNTFRLYTTSYCPMNCAFCTLTRLRKYSCGKNVPVVSLTPGQIIELIQGVLKEYPDCKQIFFVDDDFFILKQRGIDFCKEVIRLKDTGQLPKELNFICLTNINRVNEENIDVIKDAGFRVLSIGVESTSQHSLDSMDKKQTVKKIWENTKLILSRGIKPYYTLILFPPDGNINDLITDLMGFRKLGQMGVGLSVEPYFIPLKGTRFSEECYPERVRPVKIEGTSEVLWKGFSWLPKDPEVREVFDFFEKIYPKYRKYCFDRDSKIHKDKNYQAYLILDALEYSLMSLEIIPRETRNQVWQVRDILDKMEDCNVDIVGSITK